MATLISDIIVPQVFNPYFIERTAQLSKLIASGVVKPDPAFDVLALRGGSQIQMPFYTDLDGADEVLADDDDLTPGNISTGRDVATLLMRGRAWGVNDLAKALSGDDPLGAIVELVGSYWARREQHTLIDILNGALFCPTAIGDKVLDISELESGLNAIDGSTFLDACQLMGDAKDRITAVAMHSAVETQLAKDDLIAIVRDSDGKVVMKTFMDKQVIVDDNCPAAAGVYTTYLFGEGAIARGEGEAPVPSETDRDSLGSNDYLITRRHFLLHPRGIRWIGVPEDDSATNDELATPTNWEMVYEPKNVRIVGFVHQLD